MKKEEIEQRARIYIESEGFPGHANHSLIPKWISHIASELLKEKDEENTRLKEGIDCIADGLRHECYSNDIECAESLEALLSQQQTNEPKQ